MEIATGLLMGDGYLNRSSGNPYLEANMINKEYLLHLDKEMCDIGNGVRLKMTASENAKASRDSGLSPNADSENYSDVYHWLSMRHPQLCEFSEWYSSGEKVWPAEIELTPTVLKHWYCGDGSFKNTNGDKYIEIGISNELENVDKVQRMFTQSNLPKPSIRIHKRSGVQHAGKIATLRFTVEQSVEIFNHMGEPLPGFGYKWPEEFK